MTSPAGTGNRLLATLPTADLDLLMCEFENVALIRTPCCFELATQRSHLLFPHSGAISLMVEMANGQTVATALGREGAIRSPFRAVAVTAPS